MSSTLTRFARRNIFPHSRKISGLIIHHAPLETVTESHSRTARIRASFVTSNLIFFSVASKTSTHLSPARCRADNFREKLIPRFLRINLDVLTELVCGSFSIVCREVSCRELTMSPLPWIRKVKPYVLFDWIGSPLQQKLHLDARGRCRLATFLFGGHCRH